MVSTKNAGSLSQSRLFLCWVKLKDNRDFKLDEKIFPWFMIFIYMCGLYMYIWYNIYIQWKNIVHGGNWVKIKILNTFQKYKWIKICISVSSVGPKCN
jgi:hypothetical protein